MPALPKASALLTLAASCLHLLSAQGPLKTGHQHPLFPPTCIRLQATQPSASPDNTALIQSALNACAPGQAVELIPSEDGHTTTFTTNPITLPPGVTLLIDANVTLYASLITIPPSTTNIPAGLMGFGILDANQSTTLIEAQSPLTIFKLTIRNPPTSLQQSTSPELLHLKDAKLTTLAQPSAELYATAADTPPTVDLTATTAIQLNAVIINPSAATPDALVVFYDGNQQLGTAPVTNTLAQLTITPLNAGTHHITAYYPGANLLFGSVNIIVPTLTLSATATTIYSRTPITFTANLSQQTATGTITFSDGATTLNQSPLNNGTASFTTSTLSLGPHTITATYSGDTLDDPATSPDLDIQVNSNPTITALAPIPNGQPYGTPLTLTATIRPTDATGTIVFRDTSTATQLGTAALASGTATLTYYGNLSVGTHTLTAAYTGDTDDLPSTSAPVSITITALATATALTASPATSNYGTPITLTAAVTPSASTGTITFNDTTTGTLAQLPLASGTATYTTSAPLLPGPHTFTATYSGDATHATSLSPAASIQINRLPTTTTLTGLPATISAGTQPTLTATITPTTATGSITFTDANSGPLGTAVSTNGVATFTLPILLPGTHTITAAYAGDTNDGPSTSPPATTQITSAVTTLTLTAPATLPYGSAINITAAITTTATGSITLTESPANATTSALIANGAATLTLPTLPPGVHTLTATYPGDALNAKSSSPPTTLTIVPASSATTLTLAQTTIPAGIPVVFNVQVTSVAAAIPSGQIVIRVQSPTGPITLPTTTLVNASAGRAYATLSADSIALGLGTFTSVVATYAGDTDDTPSTSAPTSFNIVATPVTITLTASAQQMLLASTPPTLTATLTALTGTPTGTISFFRDITLITTISATPSPVTITLPQLPVGTYLLTAVYTPTGLFAPATSSAISFTVTPQFSVTLNPGTLSMTAPSSATSTLTITPLSGYSGTITTACTVPFPFFTCNVQGPSAIGNNIPSTGTVHVAVAKNTVETARNTPPGYLAPILAVLLFPFLSRRKLRQALTILALAATLTLTACSPGTFFDIPPGPYTLYVTVKTSTSSLSTPLIVNITK